MIDPEFLNSLQDKPRATRTSRRFSPSQVLLAPVASKTQLLNDSAWAMKLKDAIDAAVKELNVEVMTGRPMRSYESDDPNDMLFELDTTAGRVLATRTKNGAHEFQWNRTE